MWEHRKCVSATSAPLRFLRFNCLYKNKKDGGKQKKSLTTIEVMKNLREPKQNSDCKLMNGNIASIN